MTPDWYQTPNRGAETIDRRIADGEPLYVLDGIGIWHRVKHRDEFSREVICICTHPRFTPKTLPVAKRPPENTYCGDCIRVEIERGERETGIEPNPPPPNEPARAFGKPGAMARARPTGYHGSDPPRENRSYAKRRAR